MKTAILLASVVFALAVHSPMAAEDSPVTSGNISADNSAAAVAAARKRGAATASKDIHAGTFRILYYGKPWSGGKPLMDDPTGSRVQVLGGCVVTAPFVAEVEAYNNAMRECTIKDSNATHR